MAAPAYTTDLVTINTAESITGWAEPTATGWTGGGNPTQDVDYPYIQGSYAVLQATTKTGIAALMVDAGVGGVTLPTDGAFLVWQNMYSPGPVVLDTYANGGLRVMVGSGLADFDSWDVGGNDTGRNPYGGWQCWAVNPTLSYDDRLGSPTGTYRYIGAAVNLLAGIGKGYPHNVDAVRYGRGEARFSGGESANYATIAGFATQNDSTSNRWGLIQAIPGGYLWKGLISLGESNQATATRARSSNVATITFSSAHKFKVNDVITVAGLGGSGYNGTWTVASVPSTTSLTYSNTGSNEGQTSDINGTVGCIVDFRDTNRLVFVDDTRKITAAFNKIEIKHGSSRVDWTGYSFICTSPSTTASKGRIEVVNDCDVNIDACLFQDLDTTIWQTTSSIAGSIFRRCAQITQNGAVFSGCTLDNATSAATILSSNPGNISSSIFKSDGSNHAIQLTSACAGNSYDLNNLQFQGYAVVDGSTGNEVIYNNAGGTVTLYIYGGSGVVSVRNGTNSYTTVVSGSVNFSVTVKDTSVPPSAIQDARVLMLAGSGGPLPYDVTVTISRTDSTATVSHTAHAMITGDKVQILGANQMEYNGVFTITKINDNSYSYTVSGTPDTPATGTIKATYVALSGLTSSGGVVSDSRVFSDNQPITGRVRKSSTAPYYKTTDFTGSISKTTGFSTTVQLLPDQ